MDIWEEVYRKAKEQYHPEDVPPFIYAHHVVCALESENGEIYTGFCIEGCSGVMNLCAERVAAEGAVYPAAPVVSFLCSCRRKMRTWRSSWIMKNERLCG